MPLESAPEPKASPKPRPKAEAEREAEREATPDVSVVIVNWNSGDDLVGCLESLADQTRAPLEVLVVDNASADGSADRAQARFPTVTFLLLGENRGFCGGANAGIAGARGQAVLLLNPDTVFDPRLLERAVPALARDGVGFVAPKVLRFDRRTIDTTGQGVSRWLRRVVERGYGEADRGQFDQPGPVDSVCGAVALYGPRLLARLAPQGRLFDEDFFAFWEDADVGARARRVGLYGWYVPTAIAYHRRGGTRPRDGRLLGRSFQFLGRDEFVQFHILKNRYLYLLKNEPLLGLLARLPLFLVADGAVLVAVLLRRPALFRRLLGIGPLLRRAWAKRQGLV
jgi:hypothetical protein